ncbi:MAG: endo-1,4-beta-xylanase [Lewinellaceae bacterium]|nr:endo-1,4-beta-xylanase [Lewinellaceae bacterium]
MKKMLSVLIGLFVTQAVVAQDNYHQFLDSMLQADYSLPVVQQWVMPTTEVLTISSAVNYGSSVNVLSVPPGLPFTLGVVCNSTAGNNPWDAGIFNANTGPIAAGDKLLYLIWLRSPTTDATVNIFVENATTYEKEVYASLTLTANWKLYAVPFTPSAAFAVNQINLGLHLALATQTVEIAGAVCANYKQTVDFSSLPVLLSNNSYPGAEPDAPWRADAAASIEQLRKANLNIKVLGPGGTPVSGASIQVDMQQHAFKFGTAVVSNKFNGGSAYNPTYEAKLLDLDGAGHGFNEVVFENDLKWPAWEQGWFSSKAEIASDVQWLHDHGITVRGHNLAWPGWGYSPSDINANATADFIKTRIRNHITEILNYPGIGQEMLDWDVLNEITTNNDYANHFAGTPGYASGRELYAEIFKQADSIAPNAVLYLNDYVAIEQGSASPLWKSRIDELLAAGAPVEGLGFQGHFSASPTGIPKVKSIYDDFWNNYGLEAKVTEYDINNLVPQATQAAYMRDLLTITFAHPSMKGFLMWGFWDGAHWMGNAPIFKNDWSLKPSGEAFVDQVFHQWWTNATLQSNASGDASVRGFKGKYQITVTCADGSSFTQEAWLLEDTSLEIQLPCVVSQTTAALAPLGLRCSPSPARDYFTVQWNADGLPGPTSLYCFDVMGRLVLQQAQPATADRAAVDCSNWPAGIYYCRVVNGTASQSVSFSVVH